MTQPNPESESPKEDESKYEVDSEWLKAQLTGLGSSLANLTEKLALLTPNETKSNSEEQTQQTQQTPSEIEVQQKAGPVGSEVQQTKRKSRLVIHGPKMLRR